MIICCKKISNGLFDVFIVIISLALTSNSDWAIFGILMIYGYYAIKDRVKRIVYPSLYIAIPIFLLGLPFIKEESIFMSTSLGLLLNIPILFKYNGERGYSPKWVKYGYYIFYPAHLIILYLIRNFLYI